MSPKLRHAFARTYLHICRSVAETRADPISSWRPGTPRLSHALHQHPHYFLGQTLFPLRRRSLRGDQMKSGSHFVRYVYVGGSWRRVNLLMSQPWRNPRWFSCICHLVIIVLSGQSRRPLFELSFIFLNVVSYSLLSTSHRNDCSEGPVASKGTAAYPVARSTPDGARKLTLIPLTL